MARHRDISSTLIPGSDLENMLARLEMAQPAVLHVNPATEESELEIVWSPAALEMRSHLLALLAISRRGTRAPGLVVMAA